MKSEEPRKYDRERTRAALVEATIVLMLRQGYAATSVDAICRKANLTKGSFFHHFRSKSEVCRAALEAWGNYGASFYNAAWQNLEKDPLDRLFQMIDIMVGFTMDPESPCVCMLGMMSQEMAATDPEIRAVCDVELSRWTGEVAKMLTEAKKVYPEAVDFDPEAAAWYLHSIWQGSMLVSKAHQSRELIRNNLQFARHWVETLFHRTPIHFS